jgi:hypothetical protein
MATEALAENDMSRGCEFLNNGLPSRAVIAVLILSFCGLAQKAKFDYDKSVDFAKFKTYAWI